jgi:hypothetical protein|tara:strand:- start:2162 stop:2320 length:159 start_codon:yes stop_codon:yes gene_type:complete
MDYYESAKGITISKKRAIDEVVEHGVSVPEFLKDLGELESYLATDVLIWLGY